MNTWKLKIYLIAREFFQFSLLTYLILLLTEALSEGFVSFFFNLNILLGVVLLCGVVTILTYNKNLTLPPSKKMTRVDIEYSIALALVAGLFVLYKMQGLGPESLLIASITGIIILILTLLIITDKFT
jgi:hypothetical protein